MFEEVAHTKSLQQKLQLNMDTEMLLSPRFSTSGWPLVLVSGHLQIFMKEGEGGIEPGQK